jgi:ribosome-binding factor A
MRTQRELFCCSIVLWFMKHSKTSQSQPARQFQSHDRKAMQLCSQVKYALEYAVNSILAGEYGVTVVDVVPAPNTSHLLVFVQAFEELSFEESSLLMSKLMLHISALRSAVSESIHRRKTPGLSFQIVPRLPAS